MHLYVMQFSKEAQKHEIGVNVFVHLLCRKGLKCI